MEIEFYRETDPEVVTMLLDELAMQHNTIRVAEFIPKGSLEEIGEYLTQNCWFHILLTNSRISGYIALAEFSEDQTEAVVHFYGYKHLSFRYYPRIFQAYLTLVLKYGINRIIAGPAPHNEKVGRVAKILGFKPNNKGVLIWEAFLEEAISPRPIKATLL